MEVLMGAQKKYSHLHQVVVIVSWMLAAVGGLYFLNSYSGAPGAVGAVPSVWPRESALVLAEDKPTLLMFLHPKCSCSVASLHEFEKIITKSKDRSHNVLVFIAPASTSAAWQNSSLRKEAEKIPYTRVWSDYDGKEAARFGAETSGQVLLYRGDGALAFAGGITSSRAHEGDNRGEDTVLALLNGQQVAKPSSNVYGCGLSQRHHRPHHDEHRGQQNTSRGARQ
jgi:hypothetical protein